MSVLLLHIVYTMYATVHISLNIFIKSMCDIVTVQNNKKGQGYFDLGFSWAIQNGVYEYIVIFEIDAPYCTLL